MDFCKVVNILNSKSQLTSKDLEKIQIIKLGMNKSRKQNLFFTTYFKWIVYVIKTIKILLNKL